MLVKFMCENHSKYIGCPPGNAIQIAWATYGREDSLLCNKEYSSDSAMLNPSSPCEGGKKGAVARQ